MFGKIGICSVFNSTVEFSSLFQSLGYQVYPQVSYCGKIIVSEITFFELFRTAIDVEVEFMRTIFFGLFRRSCDEKFTPRLFRFDVTFYNFKFHH